MPKCEIPLYKSPKITNNNDKNRNLWGHMERTPTCKVSITYTVGTRAKKVPFIMTIKIDSALRARVEMNPLRSSAQHAVCRKTTIFAQPVHSHAYRKHNTRIKIQKLILTQP